ncbi:unnamed protein product [Rhizophagus irregularis]|uniref:Actin-like ATPase domain-containing protein n=1 Tax=Rhizophagus irregularis TaxID=588596 RepID=A0A916EED2_9GLOM|nr:unnamed protein product [Rhizophagus irregularis]
MSLLNDDIRVVVSIDFGTTYSGYACAHKSNPEDIIVQEDWNELEPHYKTPTVIKYEDESYTIVKSWGFPALAEKPSNKKKISDPSKPIELFKLHLIKELSNEKPFLPEGLDFKKVITDYLKKLVEMIKNSCARNWQNLDFYRQVLVILTIPAEFDDDAISTMRECAFYAGLTKDRFSRNLKFTTEPEAAAIYCLNSMKGQYNLSTGASFMIVDCGGGTEFSKIVPNISVPIHPIIAIIKGGVQFGLHEDRVMNRVLKRTYGTDIARPSKPDDPASEKFPNGLTIIFDALAKRGEQVPANKKVIKAFEPCSIMQQKIGFNMYVTKNTGAKFCNDPGVSLLRNWEIELPKNENIEDMEDTTILFTLSFGSVEILATAENQKTGAKYHVSFKCE